MVRMESVNYTGSTKQMYLEVDVCTLVEDEHHKKQILKSIKDDFVLKI